MRISTKGRYALRLMLDLAVNGNDNYISIKNISTRQEISDKYLEQIINQLCKAGFVKVPEAQTAATVFPENLKIIL